MILVTCRMFENEWHWNSVSEGLRHVGMLHSSAEWKTSDIPFNVADGAKDASDPYGKNKQALQTFINDSSCIVGYWWCVEGPLKWRLLYYQGFVVQWWLGLELDSLTGDSWAFPILHVPMPPSRAWLGSGSPRPAVCEGASLDLSVRPSPLSVTCDPQGGRKHTIHTEDEAH